MRVFFFKVYIVMECNYFFVFFFIYDSKKIIINYFFCSVICNNINRLFFLNLILFNFKVISVYWELMFDVGRMYIVYFFIFILIEYYLKFVILFKIKFCYRYLRSKSFCFGFFIVVYLLLKWSGGVDSRKYISYEKCFFFYIKRFNKRVGIFV